MRKLSLEQLVDLLLESVPIGEKVDIKLSLTKNRKGGWDAEFPIPNTYKIELKKESKNDPWARGKYR